MIYGVGQCRTIYLQYVMTTFVCMLYFFLIFLFVLFSGKRLSILSGCRRTVGVVTPRDRGKPENDRWYYYSFVNRPAKYTRKWKHKLQKNEHIVTTILCLVGISVCTVRRYTFVILLFPPSHTFNVYNNIQTKFSDVGTPSQTEFGKYDIP